MLNQAEQDFFNKFKPIDHRNVGRRINRKIKRLEALKQTDDFIKILKQGKKIAKKFAPKIKQAQQQGFF